MTGRGPGESREESRAGWPALDRVLARLRTVPARTGSVIATVYGDAILPRGGALALTDLIALMGRLGASEGVVRTAVSRLAQEGVLQGRRIGRRSAYALTARAEAEFSAAVPVIYGGAADWDGRLRVAFPEDAAGRGQLEAIGFRAVGPGTMVGLGVPGPGMVWVEAAGPLECLPGLAARAWPLAAVQAMYREFLEVFGGFEPPEDVAALEAMAARTVLLHAWRRVALRDPRLPAALLPEDWAGGAARRLCVAAYSGLVAGSERWLDGAGSGAGPLPKGGLPEGRWTG